MENPTSPLQAKKNQTPLRSAMKRYLIYLQAEENKSKLTIDNYARSLDLVADIVDVADPMDINKHVVRALKAGLSDSKTRQGKSLSVRTRNYHLTVLRAFLRYLAREEELNVYPSDRVIRMREEPRQVKALFKDDLDRLLAAPDTSKREGRRDKAILELFFSTGLRVSELCSLDKQDLNFTTREIAIRGKRGKIRVVFLSDSCVAALKDYLDVRLDHLNPLFIRNLQLAAKAMPPGEKFRLSRISIFEIVKKHARTAGIVRNPSPHTLRHSFATDLLMAGADLRSVQEMLGHKDLSTTQIYTHVTNPHLKDVHKKFHGKSEG